MPCRCEHRTRRQYCGLANSKAIKICTDRKVDLPNLQGCQTLSSCSSSFRPLQNGPHAVVKCAAHITRHLRSAPHHKLHVLSLLMFWSNGVIQVWVDSSARGTVAIRVAHPGTTHHAVRKIQSFLLGETHRVQLHLVCLAGRG